MHGAETVDPSGRTVARRYGRHQLDERIVAIFKAAEAGRLQHAEQFCVADSTDQLSRDMALLLGLHCSVAREASDRYSAIQQGREFGVVVKSLFHLVSGGDSHDCLRPSARYDGFRHIVWQLARFRNDGSGGILTMPRLRLAVKKMAGLSARPSSFSRGERSEAYLPGILSSMPLTYQFMLRIWPGSR